MSEMIKNIAGIKASEIKAFDDKIVPNIAVGIQQELVFDVEIEKEINGVQMGVLKNGTPYLTQTGLAKLCGIPRKTLYNIEQELNISNSRSTRIKELLKEQGYTENSLFIKVHQEGNANDYNAYPDSVCMALLEYFAFEDKRKRTEAIQNYRLLAKTSFRMYIYGQVGYAPQTQILDKWKYYLDRAELNYDTVPQGYFSVFKEIDTLIVSLIKNNAIVNDKTIPDLSVGQVWGRLWSSNNFDSQYGERVKYEHNYPTYYPQSLSNPQEPWAYPNEALAYFRKWFQNEYITNNFPKYLLTKVKQLAISPQDNKKVLEAITPKRIAQPPHNPTSAQFIKNIQADNVDINENNDFESNIRKIIKYKK